MVFLQFMVPRLDGRRIGADFDRYLELVRGGVAGFIIFGGELESLRRGITRLQEAASAPLIIASDLERGLGQQVEGGTLFPPAAAVARAGERDRGLPTRAFDCVAAEAAYAGINTVLAPVLDVDSNPENPIIATRAFSTDPARVSSLGVEMLHALKGRCIAACGKHFPGHGDTSVDSHLGLPTLEKPLAALEECELVPFREAIAAGLGMVMLGHLSVPAIDPSGLPASLSGRAVSFLRDVLAFEGIIMTDAMDMGALKAYPAEDAALMALGAGVDILLHPGDPEGLARKMEKASGAMDGARLMNFRETLLQGPVEARPPFELNASLSDEIAAKAVQVRGRTGPLRDPFVLLLSDDGQKGEAFVSELGTRFPAIGWAAAGSGDEVPEPPRGDIIVAVFSEIKAWKGGASGWLREALARWAGRARALVSFGSPHLVDGPGGEAARVYAWWGADAAQRAAARAIIDSIGQ